MTKSKHLLLAILDAFNEFGDVVHMSNAVKHAQHGLIGTAMQRSIQRTNSTYMTT